VSAARWVVTRVPKEDFSDVRVYRVSRPGTPDYAAVAVWWNVRRGRGNCVACSGPLSGMSASCPHARAVRRVETRG
jgi:hypothetical protein